MTVSIRLPRFATSTYSDQDREALALFLAGELEPRIAGVSVEPSSSAGIVIRAGYSGGRGDTGAIGAAAGILELVDQVVERELGRGGARRKIAKVLAGCKRATITVDP